MLVNSFFFAADEGFNPHRAGDFFTARGWSCFSKILGKKFYFKFVIVAVLFSKHSCLFCKPEFNIIVLLVHRSTRPSAWLVRGYGNGLLVHG